MYNNYGYVSLKQLVCNIKLKSLALLPLVCILKTVVICNDCDWDPIWKRFVDDSGFPRAPDRPVKMLRTCVRYLRSAETSIGACGPNFLGGSTTAGIRAGPIYDHCRLLWKTFKLIWIKESKLDILKFKFLSSFL